MSGKVTAEGVVCEHIRGGLQEQRALHRGQGKKSEQNRQEHATSTGDAAPSISTPQLLASDKGGIVHARRDQGKRRRLISMTHHKSETTKTRTALIFVQKERKGVRKGKRKKERQCHVSRHVEGWRVVKRSCTDAAHSPS